MHLFQIPQAFRDLEASFSEDGELTPEQIRQIDQLGLQLGDLIQSACTLIQEEDALAHAARTQLDRLKALAASHEARVERWKKYIRHALEAARLEKLSTDWFDVTLANNSQPSVIVKIDPELLPDQFLRYPKPEVDKQKLIKLSQLGEKLPDGVEVVRGKHVRIR